MKKQLLTFIITSLSTIAFGQIITTGTLIDEMTNLERLTSFPEISYKTIQFSSYDRSSTSPSNENWFANQDGFGNDKIPTFEKVLRQPDSEGTGEYLICDVNGPGAIVRLWTARFSGQLKIFLDNSETPLFEGDPYEFIQNAYNLISPEHEINYLKSFNQYDAGYYPIPFAKNCKIIWIGNPQKVHFYHVQIRKYEEPIAVKTFQPSDIETYKENIVNARDILSGEYPKPKEDLAENITTEIKAGETKVLAEITGSKTITQIEINLHGGDPNEILRQNILKIYFDSASVAQIQSPVGDFFGAAPGINPYNSLPFSVKEDGKMICRFKMPFKSSAKIVVQNLGSASTQIEAKIYSESSIWDDNNSMYFMAHWRVDHNLYSSKKDICDIPFLFANGKGRMVGAVSYLYNPTDAPSSHGNWWGEGDEKIFIDGEKFPSTFGTGSEDYYNYSWSADSIFGFAYCGQPRNDGPANRGFVTNYRWQIIDDIPFSQQFSFFMELLSHDEVPGFSYGRMIYYYAVPGTYDDHLTISKDDVKLPYQPEKWIPKGNGYSKNAVFFEPEELIKTNDNIAFTEKQIWSNGKLMLWTPATARDILSFEIEVEETSNYSITFTLGLLPEGIDCWLRIDGKDVQRFQDPGNKYFNQARNFRYGKTTLKKGKHIIEIIPNNNTLPIGVDFMWILKHPPY